VLTRTFCVAGAEVGYSAGASATVGPVKLEGDVTLGNVSVKSTEKNIVEAKVEGPALKGSASAGIFFLELAHGENS
jgi:hypothetical protein